MTLVDDDAASAPPLVNFSREAEIPWNLAEPLVRDDQPDSGDAEDAVTPPPEAATPAMETGTHLQAARAMSRVALGLGLGGVVCGTASSVIIEGRFEAIPPAAGLAMLGSFAVLLATVGVWSRDRLPRG